MSFGMWIAEISLYVCFSVGKSIESKYLTGDFIE
jgi:hypothetical protein